jgi:hypothetical protein
MIAAENIEYTIREIVNTILAFGFMVFSCLWLILWMDEYIDYITARENEDTEDHDDGSKKMQS